MLFSSSVFLCIFLPVVLIVYYGLLRRRRWGQNVFLLLASLFFYWWGEPKFVLIMLGSIVMNYLFGLWVEAFQKRGKHLLLPITCTVAANLSVLFTFKYVDFAVRNINLLGFDLTPPGIVLPIGISFFTFQAMSYVFDIARSHSRAQHNPLNVGLYIALFPQLVAGPIVKYETVEHEILHRKETWADFSDGVRRFLIGLGKKVLIANQMAVVADAAFDASAPTAAFAWLGAICYTLQIYYDFSGYSDMAIGLGRMFGFHFLENFNWPYVSKTITEFWRRWHISLSTWFRDYVYFPLGGSRVGPEMEAGAQSVCGLAADGHLAWGQLDFRGLGHAVFCAAGGGKILAPGAQLAGGAGPCLHAGDGEFCLGAVPGGGYGRGGALSGRHVWRQRLVGDAGGLLFPGEYRFPGGGGFLCRPDGKLAPEQSGQKPPCSAMGRSLRCGTAGGVRGGGGLSGERDVQSLHLL